VIYSLAFGGITYVDHSAELLLIRRVNGKFAMTEELSFMNHLGGTNTTENIFKELRKTLCQYNLEWNLLACTRAELVICSRNGAPA
jgi:hypothetical protein